MFVNAHAFPGPALWQGVMFCLVPLLFWGLMLVADAAPARRLAGWLFIGAYVGIGAGLFVWIA